MGVTKFTAKEGLECVVLIAGAALLVGDVVYMTTTDEEVNKSTTAGDYATFVGVVVGGKSTYMEVLQDDLDIGSPAASADEEVIVAIGGIVKVLADAVIATSGLRIAPATATTAGRIKTAVTTNFMVGVNLNAAAAAGDVVEMLIKQPTTASVFS